MTEIRYLLDTLFDSASFFILIELNLLTDRRVGLLVFSSSSSVSALKCLNLTHHSKMHLFRNDLEYDKLHCSGENYDFDSSKW